MRHFDSVKHAENLEEEPIISLRDKVCLPKFYIITEGWGTGFPMQSLRVGAGVSYAITEGWVTGFPIQSLRVVGRGFLCNH